MWNASASSASNAPAATPAPAVATRACPTRARNPRREVPRASASERWRPSGTHRPLAAPRGRREHALELTQRVEGALGEHGAVEVERDGERAARDVERPPGALVAVLVEHAQRHQRIVSRELDRGLERVAHGAALGGEHGERRLSVGPRRELADQLHARAELRSLVRYLERGLRRD